MFTAIRRVAKQSSTDIGKIVHIPVQAQRDPIYQNVPVQQIITSPRYGITTLGAAEMVQEDSKKDVVLDVEQQIDELNQQQAAASAGNVNLPQTSKKILTIPSSSVMEPSSITVPMTKIHMSHQLPTSITAGSSSDIKTVRFFFQFL